MTKEQIKTIASYYGCQCSYTTPSLFVDKRPLDGYVLFLLEENEVTDFKLHLKDVGKISDEEKAILRDFCQKFKGDGDEYGFYAYMVMLKHMGFFLDTEADKYDISEYVTYDYDL